MTENKYELYQWAVQDPDADVALYVSMFKTLHKRPPLLLREDFCAAFAFSCAWVKQSSSHKAICIDLDSVPLTHGRKKNLSKLNSSQKSRVFPLEQNVLSITKPYSDLVMAGNFSIFFIHDRRTLVKYFSMVLRSMNPKGASFFIEIAGGHDFVRKSKEQRLVEVSKKNRFTYYWEQRGINPINNNANYAIHFRLPNGRFLKNAFTYDWRVWSPAELLDALKEAGFKKTCVLWEKTRGQVETGEYEVSKIARYDEFWLCYVVGSI